MSPTLTLEKQGVPKQFNKVATSYDLLVKLNPGYLKHLRWSAQRLEMPPNARILDLCCGTGLSTEALVKVYPNAEITGLDASEGMLAEARKKPELRRAVFFHGDAMNPRESAGLDGEFDGILMAYGIRNMPDADLCLERLMGLLKPGGRICFHEYSVNDSRIAKTLWNAVTLGVIIPSGLIAARNTKIFKYLRRSVLDFDGASAFEDRLRKAGFVDVETRPMDGWQRGVVHSFLARRPA